MKLVVSALFASAALALSACSILMGEEGPGASLPAARAPEALPPPQAPAREPGLSARPDQPANDDLQPLPPDQVKCIPPYVLRMIEKDGQAEARCVAPSQSAPGTN